MGESVRRDDATILMIAAATGDKSAADELLPLVYAQLKRTAQSLLVIERREHTLTATALVHEAYLKLVGPRQIPWAGRAHFYAAAAQAMRRILIDYARSRASREGMNTSFEDIGSVSDLATARPERILALDDAIARLEKRDEGAAEIVKLRFYAGLSVEDAARALGVSRRTAARLWSYARSVLYQDLK